MHVIDTHVHIWEFASPAMAWLEDRPPNWDVVRRDFTWKDLRGELDEAGVSEMILVQACPEPAETRILLDMASREPSALGVVGWATLTSAVALEAHLDTFEGPGRRKLVGVRNNHGWAPDGDILATGQVLDACRLLAERDLVLDLHFPTYADLPLAGRLAERVPECVYVIDHLGKPNLMAADAFAPWAEAIKSLAELPNVFLKYSGWATFVGRTQASDVQRHVDFALEVFGADRMMFGSNWPVALVAGDYAATYAATRAAVSHCSETQLRGLMNGTARRCYRLGTA